MKIYADNHNEKNMRGADVMREHEAEGRPIPPHEHVEMRRHIPPHERKALMRVELDEKDVALLRKVFCDEDEAAAAAEKFKEAPPEIQIVIIQLIDLIELIEEVA